MKVPAPDFEAARKFCERLTGETDPAITFQVFDDKGKDFELAGWRHGKLSDPQIRAWLILKQAQGCGVFFTLNACDGKGRRRANVLYARAVCADFDGAPLPESFPLPPSIINETSPGKYHVLWIIEPDADLNVWSDVQARVAAEHGADRKVFDPPRVFRLPGFHHLKTGSPFRVRTLKTDSAAGPYSLADFLKEYAETDYEPPAPRLDGGRSDEPVAGWDREEDITAVNYLISQREKPTEGGRNNEAYRIAALLNDFAISPAKSLELLKEWNETLPDPLPEGELAHVIRSAPEYKASGAGSKSTVHEPPPFDPGPQPISAADDFEDESESEVEKVFDFEGGEQKNPEKTIFHQSGGATWSRLSEIRAEELEWLWPGRIPLGKFTIIAGFPDLGKSQMMLAIAAVVSNGGTWPDDDTPTEQGTCIIMSSEDDAADTLKPRLVAAGANMDRVIIMQSMVKLVQEGKKTIRVFNIEDDLREIEKVIQDLKRKGETVRFVGFDPIGAYFGGGKKNKADVHKNSDMRALLTPLKEWLSSRKIACIGISHFNKSSSQSAAIYRVTDSGAITQAARAVHFCFKIPQPQKDGEPPTFKRYFVPGKHNLSPDSVPAIKYEIRTDMDDRVEELCGFRPKKGTPHIHFAGVETEYINPEQILGIDGHRKPRDSKELDVACDWLTERLSGGPEKANTLFKEADESEGISKATLKKAKKRIGIISEKPAFEDGWTWRLPVIADDFRDADDE